MQSTLGSSSSCLGLPSCQSDTLLSFPSTAMLVTSTEMATILRHDGYHVYPDSLMTIPVVVSPEPGLL